ncbi:chitin-binding domain protein cbd-1-like [Ylistrum balloti]|uniref:chitin-binding domain protein cbd-1-like n=1 Tax=Ylistrum balloti TaxID=509963 RepID=UPI002905AB92|nr:chitin-binding domain protein cbd-1-like [Ylistrum balloti]
MKQLIGLCVLLAFFGSISAKNCTGVPDGIFEKNCKSYALCTSGVYSIVECGIGSVFNAATNKCDNATVVPPPCGVFKDCAGKADGRYPDTVEHCSSFYTCVEAKFIAHTFCPGSTVFNPTVQTCDWPANVDPPCGTKGTVH